MFNLQTWKSLDYLVLIYRTKDLSCKLKNIQIFQMIFAHYITRSYTRIVLTGLGKCQKHHHFVKCRIFMTDWTILGHFYLIEEELFVICVVNMILEMLHCS